MNSRDTFKPCGKRCLARWSKQIRPLNLFKRNWLRDDQTTQPLQKKLAAWWSDHSTSSNGTGCMVITPLNLFKRNWLSGDQNTQPLQNKLDECWLDHSTSSKETGCVVSFGALLSYVDSGFNFVKHFGVTLFQSRQPLWLGRHREGWTERKTVRAWLCRDLIQFNLTEMETHTGKHKLSVFFLQLLVQSWILL